MANGAMLGSAEVPGPPVPKARARVVRDEEKQITRAYTPPRTKAFEELIAGYYVGRKFYEGPVTLHLVVREGPSHPADLDNYVKIASDALNKVAFLDDRQVAHIEAFIERGVANPSLTVTVLEWHQTPNEAILTPLPTETTE